MCIRDRDWNARKSEGKSSYTGQAGVFEIQAKDSDGKIWRQRFVINNVCASGVLSNMYPVSYTHLMREETHEDTCVVRYDAKYSHDEARVTGDGEKAMLFSYDGFRIYGSDGTLTAEGSFPEAEKIYDQQFRRDVYKRQGGAL